MLMKLCSFRIPIWEASLPCVTGAPPPPPPPITFKHLPSYTPAQLWSSKHEFPLEYTLWEIPYKVDHHLVTPQAAEGTVVILRCPCIALPFDCMVLKIMIESLRKSLLLMNTITAARAGDLKLSWLHHVPPYLSWGSSILALSIQNKYYSVCISGYEFYVLGTKCLHSLL